MSRLPRHYSRTLASWGALACFSLGCSGPAQPVGANHACFRALDCEDGLVCVQGRCTSDISAIVPEGSSPSASPGSGVDAGSR